MRLPPFPFRFLERCPLTLLLLGVLAVAVSGCDNHAKRSQAAASSAVGSNGDASRVGDPQDAARDPVFQGVNAPLATPATASPCVPLIIGIKTYRHIGVLANPLNDAELVAKALKAVDVDATPVREASLATMKEALAEFREKLRSNPQAIGFFYFAGHGISSDGVNWLLPIEFDSKATALATAALSLTEVVKCLPEANPGIIVCLDCCRSKRREFKSLVTGTVGDVKKCKIIYATRPGQEASDGEAGNTLFAKKLAELIPTPGLDIDGLTARLKRDVLIASHQQETPWDEGGVVDFCFVPPTEASRHALAGTTAPAHRGLGPEESQVLLEDGRLLVNSGYAKLPNYARKGLIGMAQKNLNVGVTGKNDWPTQQAIRAFQREKSLTVSGELTQETLRAMSLHDKSHEQLMNFNTSHKLGRK